MRSTERAMTRKTLRAIALAACALAGCAGVDPIEMSGDPATLRPFKTFRIQDEQLAFARPISEAERSQVVAEMRTAVVRSMTDRGYTESTDADVLVSIGAATRLTFDDNVAPQEGRLRNVDPSVVEAGRPTTSPSAELMPPGVEREGDLFLYLLDPTTKRVLWRASTSGSATTPAEAKRRARASYSAMVGKLPKASANAQP
jgi:hypothetical protein